MTDRGGRERPIGQLIDDIDCIAHLRHLMPNRRLEHHEALAVAEWQATRLLHFWHVHEPPIPQFVVSTLGDVFVEHRPDWPTAGMSVQTRTHWRIVLNADEPFERRRFTLAHELKHLLDDPVIGHTHTHLSPNAQDARVEAICDYFAACLLMPRTWLKREWSAGRQDPMDLAWRYHVSVAAMSRRLREIGLADNERQRRRGRRSRRGAQA